MNDTKWLELQEAMWDLPFPPPFIVKCITGEDINDAYDKDVSYLGDWTNCYDEGLPPLFNIEWIKVRPRRRIYRGRLVADEVEDETEQFVAILHKYNIPFEEENGTYTIYGYS